MPNLRRLGAPIAIALATAAPAGCTAGGTPAGRPPHASSDTPAISNPSPTVPNPFTVIARYSALSLGLNNPAQLAIGPDANLYITDATQRVTVVSRNGKVLRRWGRPGRGPGQFTFATKGGVPGVLAPIAAGADGKVYVIDTGNPRVEVFSGGGQFLRQFGSSGTGRGQFLSPLFIAVDPGGNVYIADDQAETVTKFSSTGRFEWRIGGPTAGDPDLIGHFHLASVDSHGRLVTLNDDIARTLYIDAQGRKVDAFESGGCDVTVDKAGHTFVNSCQEPLTSPHYTRVFDRNHRLVGEWNSSGFGYSPRFGPQEEIFTLGEDGSILQLRVALPGA